MDGSEFDVWTRRRFGIAAGGLSASLLALAGLEDAEAKKKKKRKKKKKKCKKLGQECNPVESPPSSCCDCLACGPVFDGLVEHVCCRPGGSACSAAAPQECCSGQCINDFCFAKSNGASCSEDRQCLSFNCPVGSCAPAA